MDRPCVRPSQTPEAGVPCIRRFDATDTFVNALRADTMRELHKAGGTKEDVIGALQTLPVVRRAWHGVRASATAQPDSRKKSTHA